MDLFNKKKLADIQADRDYYLNRCKAKNKTIDTLNEQISLLNKELDSKNETTNQLLKENQKLIEWIQKILEACDTQHINEPYKSITIPIYKRQEPYKAAGDWDVHKYTKTDIYIPAIHISEVR